MFNFKRVLSILVVGTLAAVAVASVAYMLFNGFIMPRLNEGLETGSVTAVVIVTALPLLFILTVLLAIPHWMVRVFSEEKYLVIDGLVPILSDIKARKQYFDLVLDEFQPGNGYNGLAIGVVKLMGNLLVVFSILLYLSVYAWGTYIYFSVGMFMYTYVHITWIFVSLILYTLCVSAQTICIGIQNYSLNPFIRSFNPKSLVVMPCILPVVSVIYFAYVLVNYMMGNVVNIGLLNILATVGVPMINPLLVIFQTLRAVNDSKVTVDEQRKKNGEAPMTW